MKIATLYNPSIGNQYLVAQIAMQYPDLQLIEEDQSYLEPGMSDDLCYLQNQRSILASEKFR